MVGTASAATIPEQTCKKCGDTHPLTDEFFSRHAKTSTGFHTHCRKCISAWARSSYSPYDGRPIRHSPSAMTRLVVAKIRAKRNANRRLRTCPYCGLPKTKFPTLSDGRKSQYCDFCLRLVKTIGHDGSHFE